MPFAWMVLAGGALVLAGCSSNRIYTLYRSSGADSLLIAGGEDPLRIHVATFDAKDGEAYNSENCREAAKLMGERPGVYVRYWCEKGRFTE